jgi:hypothetical protein
LPELETTLQDYLWHDAATTFAGGDGEGAWPALLALYERNPAYPRLPNAVQAVGDGLIQRRIDQQDYAAARAVLELIERQFPQLELSSIVRWHEQLAADGRERLTAARAALARQAFGEARAAALAAEAILPDEAEPRELLREIQRASPEIRVGVTQLASDAEALAGMTWAGSRVARLSEPRLVELVGFGAEGGVYGSGFGDVRKGDSGLDVTLELSPASIRREVTPSGVARALLAASGEPGAGPLAKDFAGALKSLQLADGNAVKLNLERPLLRPEAFLRFRCGASSITTRLAACGSSGSVPARTHGWALTMREPGNSLRPTDARKWSSNS